VATSTSKVTEHGKLKLRVMVGAIPLNGLPFHLDLDNYASFSHMLATFRFSGVDPSRPRTHAGPAARQHSSRGSWPVRRIRGGDLTDVVQCSCLAHSELTDDTA
jgi:hypothetical protein